MPEAIAAVDKDVHSEAHELRTLIKKVLEDANDSLSANQIRQRLAIKVQKDDLQQQLAAAVAQGELHAVGTYNRSEQYSHIPLHEFAANVIVQKLLDRTLSLAELLRSVKSKLNLLTEKELRELHGKLLSEGRIRKLPPHVGARTALFGVQKPKALDYVEEVYKKLKDKLLEHGVTQQEILAAFQMLATEHGEFADVFSPVMDTQDDQYAPDRRVTADATTAVAHSPAPVVDAATVVSERSELAETILDRLTEEYGLRMALIRDLRRLHDFLMTDRREFDNALLELQREGKLALHEHGSAGTLPAEERADLLSVDGRYFNAVSRRSL